MTLRIQRSVEGDLVVFKLTGRLQAVDVPELLTAFLKSDSSWGGSGIVLDLEQVKLVDRDAVLFLALSEMTVAITAWACGGSRSIVVHNLFGNCGIKRIPCTGLLNG